MEPNDLYLGQDVPISYQGQLPVLFVLVLLLIQKVDEMIEINW